MNLNYLMIYFHKLSLYKPGAIDLKVKFLTHILLLTSSGAIIDR